MIATLKEADVRAPLTFPEYRQGLIDGSVSENAGIVLFLSAGQARELLADGRPRVFIIISSSLDPNTRPLLNLDDTLEKLTAYSTLDYHSMLQALADGLYAATDSAMQVIKTVRSDNEIVNLLDLGLSLPRSVPTILLDVDGWDLLE